MFPEDTAASTVQDRGADGWLVTPQVILSLSLSFVENIFDFFFLIFLLKKQRQQRYAAMFAELSHNEEGNVTGDSAKGVLVKSGLG